MLRYFNVHVTVPCSDMVDYLLHPFAGVHAYLDDGRGSPRSRRRAEALSQQHAWPDSRQYLLQPDQLVSLPHLHPHRRHVKVHGDYDGSETGVSACLYTLHVAELVHVH